MDRPARPRIDLDIRDRETDPPAILQSTRDACAPCGRWFAAIPLKRFKSLSVPHLTVPHPAEHECLWRGISARYR